MRCDRTTATVLAAIFSAVILAAPASLTLAAKEKEPPFQPPAGWGAYFKDEKGKCSPLLEPVELNKDKDWLGLQFTPYDGPKIRLAVQKVENKTATMEQAAATETFVVTNRIVEVPVAGIEELLTTALHATNRFTLVERKALDGVMQEQDLGASGRVAQPSAARTGVILGAQHQIFAAVNEWTPVKKKTRGGLAGIAPGALGGVTAGKSEAEVAMSFRIVDATTSEVLQSITVRATAKDWNLGFGGAGFGGSGAVGGAMGIEQNSPISYAVQAAINKAAYQIALALADLPWSGSVMKIVNDKIYVNAGSNAGIPNGAKLTVLSKGEDLIDPETGVTLGSDTTRIGSLEIVEVSEKYSVARITEGCEGIKAGDRVKVQK